MRSNVSLLYLQHTPIPRCIVTCIATNALSISYLALSIVPNTRVRTYVRVCIQMSKINQWTTIYNAEMNEQKIKAEKMLAQMPMVSFQTHFYVLSIFVERATLVERTGRM